MANEYINYPIGTVSNRYIRILSKERRLVWKLLKIM